MRLTPCNKRKMANIKLVITVVCALPWSVSSGFNVSPALEEMTREQVESTFRGCSMRHTFEDTGLFDLPYSHSLTKACPEQIFGVEESKVFAYEMHLRCQSVDPSYRVGKECLGTLMYISKVNGMDKGGQKVCIGGGKTNVEGESLRRRP